MRTNQSTKKASAGSRKGSAPLDKSQSGKKSQSSSSKKQKDE